MLDLDLISPNPDQPRAEFDEAALTDLANSLRKQGCLQPVIVRPRKSDGGFELIVGERRWRAAQIAGLLKIPAVVREVEDNKLLELALVENIQREDLNPIEAARAYQSLMNDLGLTQQDVADRVGKERATVANAVRLLNLPQAIQEKIRLGELSIGHAKALAGLADAKLQVRLAERFVRDRVSVRQAETAVGKVAAGPTPKAPPKAPDPNIAAAEKALQIALGTGVRIIQNSKGGRIEVTCNSESELRRVYDQILGTSKA